MQGAEHDRFVSVGQRDEHGAFDDRGIFRVLDAEDIPAAASDREWLKWRLMEKESNLLNHIRIIPSSAPEASRAHFVPAFCCAS